MTAQPQTMKEYDQSTPAQQAAAFREEIRTAFANLDLRIYNLSAENDSIRHDLETLINAVGTITTGIQHAATATPPTQSGTYGEMTITSILKTIDKNNKVNYMAMGVPYAKFGVRVWDEVLPLLGIDPTALEFGNNIIDPIPARVLLGETTNRETGKKGIGPHKVISKA